MIDALFGSKTRVKLLHLFLNNPGQSFYVREITRLIDEQINSVRRELSNMLEVGVITSDSADNKLYYQVNQRYEYYVPLRAIFADQKIHAAVIPQLGEVPSWQKKVTELPGIRIAVIAGMLVQGSSANVDLLIVGNVSSKHVSQVVTSIESDIGRELTYTVLSYDEFYYRLSVHDKFIGGIIQNKHQVLVDTDGILNK
jgi:hypothetical protein